ncbi:glycoside hydrolase [Streptomyces melanogenes]|uniref:glycoside hydrolase n=1 Tax=Streptomyces melanogenes TaxID=67326 RepID=UPI00167EAC5B|nr:glycoside hydrolase [Streptomyces melanogenes]
MRSIFSTHRGTHGGTPSRSRSRAAAHGLAVSLALAALAGCTTAAGAEISAARDGDGEVTVPVRGGTAVIDTASLAVRARPASGRELELSAPAATDLGRPGPVNKIPGGARWTYPAKELTVAAVAERGRLRVSMAAGRDGEVRWPVTGTDASATDLQLPRGEGLDIPVRDAFWSAPERGLTGEPMDLGSGALTMPMWGYTYGKRGVSYLVPTDIGTSLGFASDQGGLRGTATHTFDSGDDTRAYTVTFALTDGDPVAPAVDYRDWLSEHGRLGSLRDKIRANPADGKLLGAFHAYLWGDARTPQGMAELRKLGVSRMWLGYDAGTDPMSAQAVSAAKKNGYLVGPYDSFANGQDAATADSPSSAWPDRVYPDYCVIDAKGKPETGFGNRGCYLSSQAFEQAEPTKHYLADRTRQMVANGADSYFLDVDAAGDLFRDHSPRHRMTKAQDRAHRLARMKRLQDGGLVLGSESAGGWANQVVAFDHGSATPVGNDLWALQRNKEVWGGYAPEKAPKTFFKPVDLPADLAREMYDPKYRVPLYETALHGSLVNVERWELSFGKLPQQKQTRALLAMLYNVPLNYVLDGPTLMQDGPELAALQKYFAPLHEKAGTERLTSFRRLTADRAVQRTVFGDGVLTVTANFGTTTSHGVPAGCVSAKLKGEGQPRLLCPGKVVR